MQRFEGGRNRFWEIRLDGLVVCTRSGTTGTDGKVSAPKKFASIEKAEKEIARRIEEQVAKGYEQVIARVPPEPANPELEGQIIEEPTDSGRCLVYADWLQGQGHPRGELGVVQNSGATKAEQKLFEQHPELAPVRFVEAMRKVKRSGQEEDGHALTWENGFIAAARVARNSDRSPFTVRELVAELLAHPAARFLRELRIGALGPDVHDYSEVIDEIIRGCPSTLRVLSLVDLPPGSAELVFADLADVTALLAATPLLEELRLAGNKVKIKRIELANLRRLAVATADPAVLAAIAGSALPALETLQLSSGDADLPAAALSKILAAAWQLTKLAITRTANTDELVPHVVKSPLLPGLTWLDLSGGKLTDAGAGLLVTAKDKLAHLEWLDLSGNTLTAASTKQLAGLCRTVRLDNQRAVANATISDADLRRMSPDAGALAKGREVAKPKLWPLLGRDKDMYWGECSGSDVYEVWVRVPSLANGCSCPSGKRPCKHTIALAILIADGYAFEARSVPAGLTSRATSGRYYGFGE